MKRIIVITLMLLGPVSGLKALTPGYDIGLRYGIGLASLSQDPYIEGYGDKVTFTNFLLSNELILNRLFRLELDLMFDERGFDEKEGNKTRHSLYYCEFPILVKIYPLKFLYLGTGFGFAYKYKTARDPDDFNLAAWMRGIDDFVDVKLKDYDINFVLVLGFSYQVHDRVAVIAEVRHNYGLVNVNRHTPTYEKLLGVDLAFEEKFRSLYFIAGISFRAI